MLLNAAPLPICPIHFLAIHLVDSDNNTRQLSLWQQRQHHQTCRRLTVVAAAVVISNDSGSSCLVCQADCWCWATHLTLPSPCP